MLDFNNSLQDFISSQAATRKSSQFIEYTSKKQILECDKITDEHKKFIKELKGTFSFALHTSGKYLIVTLFKSKKYYFIIVNLDTMEYAECDSIKNAKLEVMNLVNDVQKTTETEEAASEIETVQEEPEKKTTKKTKTK